MSDSNGNKNQNELNSVGGSAPEALSSKKPMDINRINLKLLIICSRSSIFDAAVNYLTRRGWQSKVEDNIKDGFQAVGEFKPDFILLSVNLRSSKLPILPALFMSTFNTPVILFGEKADALTNKLIQEIKCDHKLTGLPSGPGIHRGVKNILQEMHSANNQMAHKIIELNQSGAAVEQNPTNENKKTKKGYTFTFEEQEGPNKVDLLTKSYEDLFSASKTNASAEENTKNARSDVEDSGSMIISSRTSHNKNEKIAEGEIKNLATATSEDKKAVSEFPNTKQSNGEGFGHIETQLQFEKKNSPNVKIDNGQEPKGADVNLFENKTSEHQKVLKNEANPGLWPKDLIQKEANPDQLKTETGDKFKKVVTKAAKQSCLEPSKSLSHSKGEQHCVICPIEDSNRKAYIVVSHDGTAEEAQVFFARFFDNLKSESMTSHPSLKVKEQSDVGSSYLNLDCSFPGEIVSGKFQSGAFTVILKVIEKMNFKFQYQHIPKDKKFKFSASDLVVGLNQGANIYLHMPKNEKYFMFLNKKAFLSEKQKDRLVAAGTDLFVDESEFKHFKEAFDRNKAVEIIRNSATKKSA